MRRIHTNGYPQPIPAAQTQAPNVLDENEELVEGLRTKVSALKSLSIDIGGEVKNQNIFLRQMDDDFDSAHGLLSNTMNRVKRLAQAGHNRYIFYLILFSFFVFFVIYIIMKFS